MARRLQAVTDKSVAASQFLSIEQSPARGQRNRLDGAFFRQRIGTLHTAHNKRFRNRCRAVFRLQRANGADRRGVHLGGRLAFDNDKARELPGTKDVGVIEAWVQADARLCPRRRGIIAVILQFHCRFAQHFLR